MNATDPITRKQLRQLPALRREVEEHRQRLSRLRSTLSPPDPAEQSSQGTPSASDEGTRQLLRQQERLLQGSLERCLALQNRMLQFVSQVEDSQLRQLLRYHYLDGLSWVQTAHRMHVTPESLKMACKRFFDRLES